MTNREAAKILRKHNQWRRGKNDDYFDVMKIGVAIDRAVLVLDFVAQFEDEKKPTKKASKK